MNQDDMHYKVCHECYKKNILGKMLETKYFFGKSDLYDTIIESSEYICSNSHKLKVINFYEDELSSAVTHSEK